MHGPGGDECYLAGSVIYSGSWDGDFLLVHLAPEHPEKTGGGFPTAPATFDLSVYPNPFNSTARIFFSLPRREMVKAVAYDIRGWLVSILTEGIMEAGKYEVNFRGNALTSGLYFVRVDAGGRSRVRKVMLVK